MTESNLLPCPFCGGRAQPPENFGAGPGHGRFIDCMACHANLFRYRPDPKDADTALVEAWNLRLTHPEAQGNKDLGEPAASGLEEEDMDAECDRIMAMSDAEVDAYIRAQGDDPAEVVRRFDILVRNAIAITTLQNTLRALVERVELCTAESVGIFQIAALHGCTYHGPNFSKEIEAAKLLLQASAKHEAAPTSPQPINGESELESASNGMGLR